MIANRLSSGSTVYHQAPLSLYLPLGDGKFIVALVILPLSLRYLLPEVTCLVLGGILISRPLEVLGSDLYEEPMVESFVRYTHVDSLDTRVFMVKWLRNSLARTAECVFL